MSCDMFIRYLDTQAQIKITKQEYDTKSFGYLKQKAINKLLEKDITINSDDMVLIYGGKILDDEDSMNKFEHDFNKARLEDLGEFVLGKKLSNQPVGVAAEPASTEGLASSDSSSQGGYLPKKNRSKRRKSTNKRRNKTGRKKTRRNQTIRKKTRRKKTKRRRR